MTVCNGITVYTRILRTVRRVVKCSVVHVASLVAFVLSVTVLTSWWFFVCGRLQKGKIKRNRTAELHVPSTSPVVFSLRPGIQSNGLQTKRVSAEGPVLSVKPENSALTAL